MATLLSPLGSHTMRKAELESVLLWHLLCVIPSYTRKVGIWNLIKIQGPPRKCKKTLAYSYTGWRDLWSPMPLIINIHGLGRKTCGAAKARQGGKPCQNIQLPVFWCNYDMAISMCIECLHGILATHAEGNTVTGVLSYCTSPMETELFAVYTRSYGCWTSHDSLHGSSSLVLI